MLTFIKLLLCSSSLFIVANAMAIDMPTRGPIPFESFDQNADKMISPDEYVQAHNLRKKMRSDAGMPVKRQNTPSFTDFDSNGDNLISVEELRAGREAMGRGQQNQNMMRRGQGPGMGQGMGMGRGRNMPSFSDFDLNGDGVLLKKEFYDARAKRMYNRAEQGFALRNADKAPAFESVDTNGDGKVDAKEFEYHQQQHRKNTQ